MPADAIREINNLSGEVSCQDGGKSVWLVPVYTTDAAKAATSFDVLIQPYQDPKLNNLAKGDSGGEYRYVVPRADRKLAGKIVEVGLVRSERPVKAAPSGWDGYSVVNILSGRPKSFLHLVWKTASTNSWSFSSLVSMSPFSSTSGGPTTYISRLKVVYTDEIDQAPDEAIYELNGQSADINYQFSGKSVP
ncbi:hypothetical protein BC629DRAFT_195320 [Irpex lacteus]|nr:hypothetical protein BC629DRAFT_195320 [Irpex lacteus]